MKKITAALVAVLALTLLLAGCTNNAATTTTTTTTAAETTTTAATTTTTTAAATADVTVEDITAAIIPEDLKMTMLETDASMVADLTGLDTSLVEEGKYFDPAMNVKCFTVYAAKVKDAASVDAVKAAFEARLKAQQDAFAQYLPDQYEIAQAGQVVTEGNYVALIILPEVQTAVDAFQALFK